MEILNENNRLDEIQKYMKDKIIERGFFDETPTEILLLMVEEVGELAKEIRKHLGMKIDENEINKSSCVSDEIADVFIYILSLCNKLNIDLFTALKDKETKNNLRRWV